MRNLTNSECKFLKQIAQLRQTPLRKALGGFLKGKYDKIVQTSEYIYAEGDIPIALVAHMDTVFKTLPKDIYYDRDSNVMWSPTGLGADDRAGVFAICQIIKAGLRPHIIFTTDEEVGGLGARALSLLPCPFKDLRYIIQLDRRGEKDCVFYDCDNKDFETYVEGFGFENAWGTFSDISYLAPAWKIAAVNLSIGYFSEHTTSEILNVNYMLDTIEKVKVMLNQEEIPSFEYIECDYSAYGYGTWWDEYYNIGGKKAKCCVCGHTCDEHDTFPVKFAADTELPICLDCISHNSIKWCRFCGLPYVGNSGAEGLCYTCTCEHKDDKYEEKAV